MIRKYVFPYKEYSTREKGIQLAGKRAIHRHRFYTVMLYLILQADNITKSRYSGLERENLWDGLKHCASILPQHKKFIFNNPFMVVL